MKVLITGGCGFIGSAMVKVFTESGHKCTVIDKLTYAGDFSRIEKYKPKFYKLDISTLPWKYLLDCENPDVVINLAAESHVDNSIRNASDFIQSNYIGVHNLVCGIRQAEKTPLLIHFSTDEVYGSLPIESQRLFKETDKLDPKNPYSATKAASDLMIESLFNTYRDFKYIIVRPCNNFGPNQNKEKLIPTIIENAKRNEPTPIYGDGLNMREWLHTEDTVEAILLLAKKYNKATKIFFGEIYNLGSGIILSNLSIVEEIYSCFDLPPNIKFISDRPGHDRKYAINCTKIKKISSWSPKRHFQTIIPDVIKSYL